MLKNDLFDRTDNSVDNYTVEVHAQRTVLRTYNMDVMSHHCLL
jgi:hypothetical protein